MQAARNAEKTGGPFAKTFAMAAINWVLAQTHPIITSCSKHPISPPPELFAEWFANSLKTLDRKVSRDDTGTTGLIAGEVAIQAARWGADQELEACCKWLPKLPPWSGNDLRKHRRPKPPSRKEQALEAIGRLCASVIHDDLKNDAATIRRALEALDD